MTVDSIPKEVGLICGLGNPLLDVVANVDKEFLDKWNMGYNDAIMVEEKNDTFLDEMKSKYSVEFIAGGATQNTMKFIEWLYHFEPNVCSFFGCVGNDELGDHMRNDALKNGVNVKYLVDENVPTGFCTVAVSNGGKNRSLCAFLGAAKNFKVSHLEKHWDVASKAKYFYASAFHIPSCFEAIKKLALFASEYDDRLFTLNLSAPFLSQFFSEQLFELLTYSDVIFGNSDEASALAIAKGWNCGSTSEIAKKITELPHVNKKKFHLVVITQGQDPVIVASSENWIKEFPVTRLSDNEIVDTNGAGDGFVAGFISQHVLKKSIEECVRVGTYTAQQVIKNPGASCPKHQAEY